MRVFITGGTGYVGRPTVRALVAAGHAVRVLARSTTSAAAVAADGATPVEGTVYNIDTLASEAEQANGVIHLAQVRGSDAGDVDRAASTAMLDGIGDGVYLHTSGTWVWGNTGGVVDESAPLAPPAPVQWRPANEAAVLARASAGQRPVIVAPGLVYGHSAGLIENFYAAPAREAGHAVTVGDGANHWSLIHVDDLAELYVRALDAAPGAVIAGVDDEPVTQKAVVTALATRLGGLPVVPLDIEAALAQMGPLADAFVLDQQISNARARRDLGWAPRHTAPLEDLAH